MEKMNNGKMKKCKCRQSVKLSQRAIDELSAQRGLNIQVTIKAECRCGGVTFSTTKIYVEKSKTQAEL